MWVTFSTSESRSTLSHTLTKRSLFWLVDWERVSSLIFSSARRCTRMYSLAKTRMMLRLSPAPIGASPNLL